jgi:hypothetical protein
MPRKILVERWIDSEETVHDSLAALIDAEQSFLLQKLLNDTCDHVSTGSGPVYATDIARWIIRYRKRIISILRFIPEVSFASGKTVPEETEVGDAEDLSEE